MYPLNFLIRFKIYWSAGICLVEWTEPRGSADDFDSVLKGYYDSINGKRRTSGRFKHNPKKGIQHPAANESEQSLANGAAFLAVCRGKVLISAS